MIGPDAADPRRPAGMVDRLAYDGATTSNSSGGSVADACAILAGVCADNALLSQQLCAAEQQLGRQWQEHEQLGRQWQEQLMRIDGAVVNGDRIAHLEVRACLPIPSNCGPLCW